MADHLLMSRRDRLRESFNRIVVAANKHRVTVIPHHTEDKYILMPTRTVEDIHVLRFSEIENMTNNDIENYFEGLTLWANIF